jgi:exoribonuclease-2
MLLEIARRAMIERGLEPDFSPAAIAEVERLPETPPRASDGDRDLRELPWCSIDNDDSRDLDQLTVGKPLDGDGAIVWVAVADVGATVAMGSAVDSHAHANTTSVYTPPRNFPMLPDRLSTDLTSLIQDQDRRAVVVEMRMDGDRGGFESSVYRALVRNRAKLAYPSVGAWLEGAAPAPPGIDAVPGLADNLRLQDRVAQRLKKLRHEQGALELESLEVRAHFEGDRVTALTHEERNRARELIEDLMIAANGAVARFLEERRLPLMRRVVRTPERWPRIVDIARAHDATLPEQPDPRALHDFLVRQREEDPLRFPDLSLSVIKLLGRGEYVASFPGEAPTGHFGLAVREYTHSTAPNRRYPDLITQRMLEAALSGGEPPYDRARLEALATHCTQRENDADKVERLMRKAAAACLLADHIGEEFDGIVTGASEKGTWVRIFDPPSEGKVIDGSHGLDVGDRVRVKLKGTNPEKGFIDFAIVGRRGVK